MPTATNPVVPGNNYTPKPTGGTGELPRPAVQNLVTANQAEQWGMASTIPGFNFPSFNINTPNLAWNPTEGQRTDWLAEAERGRLTINPR